ncbi:hypothetical protein [Paenibacillus tyrfis]|uniref:Uncharacterized protein n=1 Tax=Paenibacillus tyrfis TaxID=1501230 RepID=A0A081NYB3_9BACL|nr:hypothetical protein [Paenibacillus tyrfis]KEQ23436.1 hypothetical protein ET33_16555 [Paenibacillus tyrfis]
MSGAVTTKIGRLKMLAARRDGTVLAKITTMAFGTGTTAATINDTKLEHECIRVPITYGTPPDDITLVYVGRIPVNSQADHSVITEAAIFDSDGDMIARKVFGGKAKDPEDVFDLYWNEVF